MVSEEGVPPEETRGTGLVAHSQTSEPHLRADGELEFGWRVHSALVEWTKNVDVKASIILALLVAAGGVAANDVLAGDGALHDVHGAKRLSVIVMGLLGAGAVFFAGWAVIPNLRARRVKDEAASGGLIFFGHLRLLDADQINRRLTALSPDTVRYELARQLHAMSVIAWRKHRRLQLSLWLAFGGAVAYTLARVIL